MKEKLDILLNLLLHHKCNVLTLSPFLNDSLGISSSRLIIASLLPRSTIRFPNSLLLTTPIAISPTLSLYSVYCLDLSASLTFCIITPFAF